MAEREQKVHADRAEALENVYTTSLLYMFKISILSLRKKQKQNLPKYTKTNTKYRKRIPLEQMGFKDWFNIQQSIDVIHLF